MSDVELEGQRCVESHSDGMVLWLRLNRPDALNALSVEMLRELAERLEAARDDPNIRVVVLTGTGRSFSAGGDIKALSRDMDAPAARGTAQGGDYLDHVARTFTCLRQMSKPVLACVNGVAVGGGLELILCCDLVVAAAGVKVGDGHSNFGIFPGGGSSVELPRRLPLNVAKYLLFSGQLLPVEAWLELGIVNEVVEPGELIARTQAIAAELAERSPLLISRMKRTANRAMDMSLPEALRYEMSELREHMLSYDMREGTRAFVEKRRPRYLGR